YAGRLFLEERKGKLGLGTAYIHGFRWALARQYEYICEMDADFSHNPEDLVRLYETASTTADMVIGSRYITGVNVVNWPMSRVLMRSEEHTSELQSRFDLVCRLLLEKKK